MLLIGFVCAGFWLLERDFPAAEVDAKYRNAASQYLTLADGSRVHYRDQGLAGGLPLVLIHGSNASLHTWEPWVAELGDRYRIVTVDLPGHGLTGRTKADDYSSESYIAVVKALRDELGLPAFMLGGNSMGGGVSWRYALAHPSDVRGLLLLNASGLRSWRQPVAETTATQDAEQTRSAPLAFSLLRQPWFAAVARYIDPYYLIVQGLNASIYDPEQVTDALIDRYYDLSMRAGTRDATLKRFGGPRNSEQRDLSQISVPVLIQWGKYDGVIPVRVGERFAGALRDAKLIVYDEVGHTPMEEIPARSAADVHGFIQERIVESTL